MSYLGWLSDNFLWSYLAQEYPIPPVTSRTVPSCTDVRHWVGFLIPVDLIP